MDYEKKYKEALEKARVYHKANLMLHKADENTLLEDIFPELTESEDEKTRKELLVFIENWKNPNNLGRPLDNPMYTRNEEQCNKYIAWLEKQGEQRPADKYEPKFFEGEWVVCKETGSICQIKNCMENVTNHKYGYELTNGGYIASDETNHFHLWTVKDVKDGDVLQLGGVTAIFKKYIGQGNCICYCSVCEGEFEVPIENGEDNVYGCIDAMPATKEQREALMKGMDEAGYTFDFETKELYGLKYDNNQDYVIEGLYHAQRILEKTLGKVDGYQTDDGISDHKAAINAVKKLNEQKSVKIEPINIV